MKGKHRSYVQRFMDSQQQQYDQMFEKIRPKQVAAVKPSTYQKSKLQIQQKSVENTDSADLAQSLPQKLDFNVLFKSKTVTPFKEPDLYLVDYGKMIVNRNKAKVEDIRFRKQLFEQDLALYNLSKNKDQQPDTAEWQDLD